MRRGMGMKGDTNEGIRGYERRGTEERHKGIWEGMWGYKWNGMEAVGGVWVYEGEVACDAKTKRELERRRWTWTDEDGHEREDQQMKGNEVKQRTQRK